MEGEEMELLDLSSSLVDLDISDGDIQDKSKSKSETKKHQLTPSKGEVEPTLKRIKSLPSTSGQSEDRKSEVSASTSSQDITKESTRTRTKLTEKFCKERKREFVGLLNETYTESPGKEVPREEVLTVLNLEPTKEGKKMATKAITDTFKSSQFSKRKGTYKNIRKSLSFKKEENKLVLEQGTEINQMRELLRDTGERIDSWRQKIASICKQQDPDPNYVKVVVDMYDTEVAKFMQYHDSLDRMYEREILLLMDKNETKSLSARARNELSEEFNEFLKRIDLNFRETFDDKGISDQLLNSLRVDFRTLCPLLFDIMKTLFPVDAVLDSPRKELSVVHALSLLMSLRNCNATNDVKLMFSLMLISFGVGTRLMNILSRMNLTQHWETLGNFLDKYVEKKNDIVKSMTPCKKPLILLLDNINMYQGSKKYHRLFRVFGPKMWNFTGRGVIVPDISGIEHLFKDSETAVESQSDLLKLDINDALIDNNTEHHSLWDLWINYYLLDILSVAFSFVSRDLEFSKLSENEFNTWLSKVKFEEIDTSSCKIDSSNLLVKFRKTYSGSHSATKTAILNLSLENNATVTGTGAILQEFANQFDIPASEKQEYLPYDASTKTFVIKHARNHIEFLRMMYDHEHEMANYEKSLYETEKRLAGLGQGLSDMEFAEGVHWDAEEGGDLLDEENETALEDVHLDEELEFDIDDDENLEKAVPCATLAEKKKTFKREDEIFYTTYARLLNKMWKFHQQDCLDEFILHLCNRKDTYSVTDHLGRTITHVAVEQNHELLLECILAAGYNPNVKEHCGATPLTLAVIKKSTKLVKLLLSAGANVRGPLYAEIPTPLEMARKLELAEIYELMNPVDSDDDDECLLYYDEKLSTTVVVEQQQESSSNETSFDRSTPGFLTGVVGDCGTCKSNRGAMERSSCLNWMGIIPGDLHMKGSLSECCYKEHGVGGLLYITRNVMKRPGLKEEVFKEKKYDHDNLRKTKEAVKDCARRYGLAEALEFRKSPFFPNPGSLRSCFRKNGNHNMVMYASFRAFIEHASTENASFKYRGRMFLHYGPLLELFDFATLYNAGLARETCYILQLPSYAHLNFRNYYTETFIHVLNFISKWPLAFRKLVQQNSSVNIHGMKGAGIEHDAWVESRIVKATKNATSGHATVTTCRRLAGAIDIVRSVRECYLGRDAFDDHTTKRHSAPSSIPDQLKGDWFSLSKGLICSLKSDSLPRVVTSSDTDDNPATVPKFFLDVHAKGVAKMSANFTKKIYDSFPDTRFQILNNN